MKAEATEYLPTPSDLEREAADDLQLAQLAALPQIDYERQRAEAAKKLGIARVGILDKLVEARRKDLAQSKGHAEDVWQTPVQGRDLLAEIKRTFNRFCYLPAHAADVLAVWALQTYCFKEFEFCGVVVIWSAEPECGKGRVLDTLAEVVSNAFRTANTSAAVLYHTVEKKEPTLLIDELDSQREEQQEAIGNVLKSGFQRNGTAHRMAEIGGQQTVVEFRTFGPKAVATIGLKSLDKASRTRAISIHMQRKPRDLKVEKFRRVQCLDLRAQCRRWVRDNLEAIRSHPLIEVDEAASDRQEDVWEPLVILGRIVGDGWEERIRSAARVMSGGAVEAGGESLGHRTLFAIKAMFSERGVDRSTSKDVCSHLNALESESFGDLRRGDGLNPHLLATLLQPYRIGPGTIRLMDGKTAKGYLLSQFTEAWERYDSASSTVGGTAGEFAKGNSGTKAVAIDENAAYRKVTDRTCDVSRTSGLINAGAGGDGVTFENPDIGTALDGEAVAVTQEVLSL